MSHISLCLDGETNLNQTEKNEAERRRKKRDRGRVKKDKPTSKRKIARWYPAKSPVILGCHGEKKVATNVICQLARKFWLTRSGEYLRIIFILFAQAYAYVCIIHVARVQLGFYETNFPAQLSFFKWKSLGKLQFRHAFGFSGSIVLCIFAPAFRAR